jgi:hypothetical protein
MKDLPLFEAIKEAKEAEIPYLNGLGEPLPWEAEHYYSTHKFNSLKNTGEFKQIYDTANNTR